MSDLFCVEGIFGLWEIWLAGILYDRLAGYMLGCGDI